MKHFFILTLFFWGLQSFAQKTIALGDSSSPDASLDQVSWIVGHWRGEAFGGTIEEVWTPALGESMMGSFKMVMKNEVSFYELMHIQATGGTLLLQIRHFNKDFTGWETQNESQNFPLVKITERHIYFDGLTFERVSENEMSVHVLMSEAGEEAQEATFTYKRFSNR